MRGLHGGANVGERQALGSGLKWCRGLESPGPEKAPEQLGSLLWARLGQFQDVVETTEQGGVERMSGVRRRYQKTFAAVSIQQLEKSSNDAFDFANVAVVEPCAT